MTPTGRCTGPTPRPAAGDGPSPPPVDVIVLAWRNPSGTVATLDSLRDCTYPALRVVVVDNGPGDGSGDVVWRHLRRLWPDASRVEPGQRAGAAAAPAVDDGPRAVFVPLERNRGFAGGMNAGLEVAHRAGRGRYFWLLANDITVEPDALSRLVQRCDADPRIGLCGATQHRLDADGNVRGTIPGGFRYSHPSGWNYPLPYRPWMRGRPAVVQRCMNAVQGAAVFGSYRFLDAAGHLSTERFAYFEEIEWARRAKQCGFTLAWEPTAVVRNRHAKTMHVSPAAAAQRLAAAHYLMARGGVVYTRRFCPQWLPFVVAARLVRTAEDALRKGPAVAGASLAGLLDGFTGRHRSLPLLEPADFPDRRHGLAPPIGR